MDLRILGLIFASVVLAASGYFYGAAFMRKKNYLLGLEWLVIAVSASNAAFFFATNNMISFEISHFFDAFSRGVGAPVIGAAGFMMLTHGFKPSLRLDLGAFVVGFVFALLLMFVVEPSLPGPLHVFYLVMWTLFAGFLLYITVKLWNGGERGAAALLLVASAANQVIASIYDFVPILGDAPGQPFNFYFLAELAWALLLVVGYYAYVALERAMGLAQSERPSLSAVAS